MQATKTILQNLEKSAKSGEKCRKQKIAGSVCKTCRRVGVVSPKSLAPFGAWLLWGGAIGRCAHRARNSRHLYQDCATLQNNQCSIATTAASC